MSVRRRADRNTWVVDVVEWIDGKQVRVRETAPVQNRREAERYAHEIRQRLRENSYEPPKTVQRRRFDGFAPDYLVYARVNNKPSEVDTKESVLRTHLVPFFGEKMLHEITAREIERYKDTKLNPPPRPIDLPKGARWPRKYAPKTVNNHLTILNKALGIAVEWGDLTTVPPIKWLHVPDADFDFFDFDEAARLVAAADPEWHCMIVVALRCGLRQGELLALSWDDVDLVKRTLTVRRSVYRGQLTDPKGKRVRHVSLSDDALVALRAQRARTFLASAFVFGGAEMLTKGRCKWPLWRTCRKAGLRRIGWHVLRHSFASHLVMVGASMRAVQELMGHASLEMTMVYAHLSPGVKHDAVNLLDRASRGTVTAPLTAQA